MAAFTFCFNLVLFPNTHISRGSVYIRVPQLVARSQICPRVVLFGPPSCLSNIYILLFIYFYIKDCLGFLTSFCSQMICNYVLAPNHPCYQHTYCTPWALPGFSLCVTQQGNRVNALGDSVGMAKVFVLRNTQQMIHSPGFLHRATLTNHTKWYWANYHEI